MKPIALLTIFFALLQGACSDDFPIEIKIHSGETHRIQPVVSVDLDSLTLLNERSLQLYKITDGQRQKVSFQIIKNSRRRMYWICDQDMAPGTSITYLLARERTPSNNITQGIRSNGRTLTLTKDFKNVLTYHATTVPAPPGTDEAYKRSGFVHPLYAPNGAVLTAIQPADHYHHYGIWNPWTKTTFKAEEVDFWNLAKKQGTVQHARILRTTQGPVLAEMEFLHNHIAWPETTRQTLAMRERQIIRSFNRSEDVFMVEFEFHISPLEEITLEEYRYGGFVFRGTDAWTNSTSDFITSEGLNRDQADGQRARWCMVSGTTQQGKAGILFMGHPSNFNSPEPLRVWPSDANNGRGDVFINFSPTRNTSWTLTPSNTYILRYRLIVFDGEMDLTTATRYYNDYANPIKVETP